MARLSATEIKAVRDAAYDTLIAQILTEPSFQIRKAFRLGFKLGYDLGLGQSDACNQKSMPSVALSQAESLRDELYEAINSLEVVIASLAGSDDIPA